MTYYEYQNCDDFSHASPDAEPNPVIVAAHREIEALGLLPNGQGQEFLQGFLHAVYDGNGEGRNFLGASAHYDAGFAAGMGYKAAH